MNRKIIPLITMILILGFILSGCDNFSLIELLSNDIALVPSEVTLNLKESVKFNVRAGIAPFAFTAIGDGSVPDGNYTAPGTAGSYTILVEDGRKRTAEADVTVVDAISILPEMVTVGIWGNISYTIEGGVPDPVSGYIVESVFGLGTPIYDPLSDKYSFEYTVGSNEGYEVIRVTDSLGQIAEVNVSIINDFNLMIIPKVAEVLVNGTLTFTASGGTGIYNYSIISLPVEGSINPTNGKYSAPASSASGFETIRVSDNAIPPEKVEATVYIVDFMLTINPSVDVTLNHIGDQITFSAFNGTPPYRYSILWDEPSGSIDSETGIFTALVKDPSVTVIVTDFKGITSSCKVKIKDK